MSPELNRQSTVSVTDDELFGSGLDAEPNCFQQGKNLDKYFRMPTSNHSINMRVHTVGIAGIADDEIRMDPELDGNTDKEICTICNNQKEVGVCH